MRTISAMLFAVIATVFTVVGTHQSSQWLMWVGIAFLIVALFIVFAREPKRTI